MLWSPNPIVLIHSSALYRDIYLLLLIRTNHPVSYTPSGEEIYVVNVSLYTGAETLLIQGADPQGNPCDVTVQPQSAQLVLKLITLPEPPPESPSVGFNKNR